eukprot:4716167-Amphidinium_carterae.1
MVLVGTVASLGEGGFRGSGASMTRLPGIGTTFCAFPSLLHSSLRPIVMPIGSLTAYYTATYRLFRAHTDVRFAALHRVTEHFGGVTGNMRVLSVMSLGRWAIR